MNTLLNANPIIDLLKAVINFFYIPLIVFTVICILALIASMVAVHLAKCSGEIERMISAKRFAQISFVAAIISVVLLPVLALFYELA